MMTERFFMRIFGVSAGFILILIMAFNYTVDPNNRYRLEAAEKDLARLAVSRDQALAVPENYDDRTLLRKFVEAVPQPFAAVLGGSRVMNLQPAENSPADQQGFLNAGVSGGSLKDYIALWQILKQCHKIPEWLYFGIDPQSMNRAQQNTRWLSVSDAYQAFFKKEISGRYAFAAWTAQWKDLLALATTRAALKHWGAERVRPHLVPRFETPRAFAVRLPSFAMAYPADYENKPQAEVNQMARANGQGEAQAFIHWNTADTEYAGHLRALLQDMRMHGVKVVLVLMPPHPLSLAEVRQSSAAQVKMLFFREQLAAIALASGVVYYDGFAETERGRIREDLFLDGVHLKADANLDFFSRVGQAAQSDIFTADDVR